MSLRNRTSECLFKNPFLWYGVRKRFYGETVNLSMGFRSTLMAGLSEDALHKHTP